MFGACCGKRCGSLCGVLCNGPRRGLSGRPCDELPDGIYGTKANGGLCSSSSNELDDELYEQLDGVRDRLAPFPFLEINEGSIIPLEVLGFGSARKKRFMKFSDIFCENSCVLKL